MDLKVEAKKVQDLQTVKNLTKKQIGEITEAILDFSEHFCGISYYYYQRKSAFRIVESILLEDCADVSILFGRQMGKSKMISVIIASLCVILPLFAKIFADERIKKFKDGFFVGIFAPTHEQGSIIYKYVQSTLESDTAREIMKTELGFNLRDRSETLVSLPNGSFVDKMSASKQSRIEGHGYHLIVCDETQDIDADKLQRTISPMGAATAATSVFVGTPSFNPCEFYNIIRNNIKEELETKIKNHYQYDYSHGIKCSKAYKKYLTKEQKKHGWDGDFFRVSYRLHWILEKGLFIDQSVFDEAGRDFYVTPYDSKNIHVAGLDLGKQVDSTVLTIIELDLENAILVGNEYRCPKKIKNWLEIKHDNYERQYEKITSFLSNYKIMTLVVDASSGGDVVVDRLRSTLELDPYRIRVTGFVFTVPSKHNLYKYLHEEFVSGRVTYPDSKAAQKLRKQQNFKIEFYALEKRYIGRYMSVNHPDSKHQNYHDDHPDSTALAVWGERDHMLAKLEVTNKNPFFEKKDIWGRHRRGTPLTER